MTSARASFAFLLAASALSAGCSGAQTGTGTKDKVDTAPTASTQAQAPVGPTLEAPPRTPKKPEYNEYHGARVADDYQWLENGTDIDVKSWIGDHNRRTRAFLDLLPGRQSLYTSVRKYVEYASPAFYAVQYRGGTLFAMRSRPPKQQPFLVTLTPAENPNAEKVLVDPTALDRTGSTSIDFYVPSPDGQKVAVALSKGREGGEIHTYDVGSGREIGETVPQGRGRAAVGIAWNGGGTGFWYTRYPGEGEVKPEDKGFYQQVWFHKLYTPIKDDTVAIKDVPRLAEIELDTSEDGKFVMAHVEDGYGGKWAHWIFRQGAAWTKVADFGDEVHHASVGPEDDLYLVSRKGAPRGRVLRTSAWKPALAKAEAVVAPSDAVIEMVKGTPGRLYVVDTVGGPSQIRIFERKVKAKELGKVPILPTSYVDQLVAINGDDLLFHNESFTEASAFYRFRASSGKVEKTAMAQPATADFSDATVERTTCVSRDGTQIPLSILRRKDAKMDGSNPTLLSGLGGFGLTAAPDYDPTRRVWLDVGGVVAVANLRGGDEMGDDWHKAGMLTEKQNAFDDLFACAQKLFDLKVTRPDRLALMGHSQAPLMMGAAITQHPEMFRAVVARGGVYDMLRLELAPNGAYDVNEYGSVGNKDQFNALYGYSPYHRVQDGKPYPAVLFLTGDNDPRGDPSHARKMAARLLAATTSKEPILLRSSGDTGRGMGTPLDHAVLEAVDVYTFLFHVLGIGTK
jgi:prolyl oligopeptidase